CEESDPPAVSTANAGDHHREREHHHCGKQSDGEHEPGRRSADEGGRSCDPAEQYRKRQTDRDEPCTQAVLLVVGATPRVEIASFCVGPSAPLAGLLTRLCSPFSG